MSINTGQKTN